MEEEYQWNEERGTLKRIATKGLGEVSTPATEQNMQSILTELKIPLYLIGAGIAIVLLIMIVERKNKSTMLSKIGKHQCLQ